MNRNTSSTPRNTSFWRDEAGWPRDDPAGKYVFFGRAVLRVGKSMFPESWTDLDPKLAFLNSNADRDMILRAVERVEKVSEALGTAIAREDVYFALRPIEQGAFKVPVSDVVEFGWLTFGAQDWNIDDYAERFMYGKMADGRRGHPLAGPTEKDWIFVHNKSLEQWISRHYGMATTPQADRKGAGVGTLQKAIGLANQIADQASILRWTQQEAENQLADREIFPDASRKAIREAYKQIPKITDKIGPRGSRNPNRVKELTFIREALKDELANLARK